MTTFDSAIVDSIALIHDPRQSEPMPGRFREMPISSTLIVGGLAVAVTGTVVQVARATVGPQMLAAVGGPMPPTVPDVSAWTGTAIAIAGAATAIFTAIGKVLIDLYMQFNAAKAKAESDRADAEAKAEKDRLDTLIEKIGEMAEKMGAIQAELTDTRAELAEANRKLEETNRLAEHTNKNVKQAQTLNSNLLHATHDMAVENAAEIKNVKQAVQSGSSSGIFPKPTAEEKG